ncbi:MAG TPA: hypothetical protein DCR55_09660 [Lentisphaeria bacterium]|nr:hypothetical protein [Lentisphaeria bacterium]
MWGLDQSLQRWLTGPHKATIMPEAVNTALHQWLQDEANVRIHRTTNKRPVDMFEEEKPALQPLPGISQPCCAVDRSVSNSCCRITVGDNYYSIPAAYAS